MTLAHRIPYIATAAMFRFNYVTTIQDTDSNPIYCFHHHNLVSVTMRDRRCNLRSRVTLRVAVKMMYVGPSLLAINV